jgi:Zn-dependent M28 family amino/carboxypeptidase
MVSLLRKLPGRSFTGPLPPLTPRQAEISRRLREHVQRIASGIGGRSIREQPQGLAACAAYIEGELRRYGLVVERQTFTADCMDVANVVGERSASEEIIVFGAHYDTCLGRPGANDNASGIAATLYLAETLKNPARKSVRFAFFANEEPPYFQTEQMGSVVYAAQCRYRPGKIVAMLSLDTIGYYSDVKGSQGYPFGLDLGLPDTGNFIGFVSNSESRALLEHVIGIFRANAKFPSEGIAAPEVIPGVGWSDHWSFWRAGYPALMVTDTAPYRYPHYHQASDTPDKVDYDRLARVTEGLVTVMETLADET